MMYVGQTIQGSEKRFKEHCMIAEHTKRNLHMYNSMRKYGIDNFEMTVLESDVDVCDLDEREMYYIEKYDTFKNGYNSTLGGGGMRGYHHSEETRKKMGEAISKSMWKINTPERTAKIIATQKGRKFSDEHKQHIREACVGKRLGRNNAFYGKSHTDETKRIISEANSKYSVCMIDATTDEVVHVFDSVRQAATFCIESTLTSAKLSSVMYRIYYTCNGSQRLCYNHRWKYMEKCIDYPDLGRDEDELHPEVLTD